MSIEIVPLSRADIPDAVECVQRAFADDPYFRWAFNVPAKVRDVTSFPRTISQAHPVKFVRECERPSWRTDIVTFHLPIVQRPAERSFPRCPLPIWYQLQLSDLGSQDKPRSKRPKTQPRAQTTTRDHRRRGLVVLTASILHPTDLVNLGPRMAPLFPTACEQHPFLRPRRAESLPVLDLEAGAAGSAWSSLGGSAWVLFLQLGRR